MCNEFRYYLLFYGKVVKKSKMLEKKYKEAEREIIKLHSYDTPCIIALPAIHVAEKYYHWLKEEIGSNSFVK